MTRVVVFNDSATVRTLLVATLRATEDFYVVAEAADGRGAVELCRRSGAELVLMDIVMPHVDGLVATRAVASTLGIPVVVVSDVFDVGDPDEFFGAMGAGAVFMTSPPRGSVSSRSSRAFVQMLRNIIGEMGREHEPSDPGAAKAQEHMCALLGIAASAGGPAATAALLEVAAPNLPPTLLVQHLAAGFADSYARWLTSTTGVPVRVASGGEPLTSGVVYMAPAGRHLATDGERITILEEPRDTMFRPSADILFASMPGPGSVAIVLSGMGDDGARGATALRRAGGRVWVQDERSSVVYAMPRAARTLAGVDSVGSPEVLGLQLKGSESS